MLVWGWVSDRMDERRWNLFFACTVAAIGLIIAGQTIGTPWAIFGMSIAAIGLYGSKGPFWTFPSMILTGTAAASGIAWINCIGNLGGFFGPMAVGWTKDHTGSFASGLYVLAGFAADVGIVHVLAHLEESGGASAARGRAGGVICLSDAVQCLTSRCIRLLKGIYASASAPACATCSSSCDCTPDTPMAPTHSSACMTGTAP